MMRSQATLPFVDKKAEDLKMSDIPLLLAGYKELAMMIHGNASVPKPSSMKINGYVTSYSIMLGYNQW